MGGSAGAESLDPAVHFVPGSARRVPNQIRTPPPTHGRPRARGGGETNRWEGRPRHGRRDHEAAARGGCPLRTPDPSLGPEDEAVHPRRAVGYLHHRPPADPRADRVVVHVRTRPRRRRWQGALRRDEAPGAGRHPLLRREVWHALCEPAVAGRHAHQLPDDLQAGVQDAGVPAHARLRRVRGHAEEGGPHAGPRAGEARAQPGRHPGHGAPARRHLRAGHREGAHRGHRGQQAGHSDCRRGRHRLQPGRHPVPHPR